MFGKKRHKDEQAKGHEVQRTPYRYGGSLGWVASMMDPETSSWKPMPLNNVEPKPDERQPESHDQAQPPDGEGTK
jgi:hypothetical protein